MHKIIFKFKSQSVLIADLHFLDTVSFHTKAYFRKNILVYECATLKQYFIPFNIDCFASVFVNKRLLPCLNNSFGKVFIQHF